MRKGIGHINRDFLSLVSELCQVVRFCRQDSTFCEDVTFTQFLRLDEVAKKEMLKMLDLHKILAVDKSTTTRLVNPLVRQGLIERKTSDHDSRAVNLRLTPAGEKVHRKVWLCLEGFVGAIEGQIPQKRRKQVYDAVKIFINAVKKASSACACTE